MEFQLWRNATVLVSIDNIKFLVDPMLGEKSSFGAFPYTEDPRANPLVDLPFSGKALRKQLQELDAVVVTHLHPDHWDAAAVQLLDKKLPIICPEIIAKTIVAYGFTKVIPVASSIHFKGIEIVLTEGKHGTGAIEEKMGVVNGFVCSSKNESIYFAGDTIWCDAVKSSIGTYQPRYVVVAGGAATFAIGEPVTMSVEHLNSLAATFPEITIIITHLEAVSPCTEDREFIRKEMAKNGLSDRCLIPKDGAHYSFH
ncbi:MBL fold metallo-hydrolase [Zunongwangia pacifica]|uniref:MBL fold metallo-hydrolase n=1 Tax=Zunongwangia pacifica TaxID=2911062 RepID=A0A9X1ZUY6_9FLAO|nr:MBL fold metallo-hydrolase [Zunongwangia pacifica]MCL6220434.1 MBL fold metallo-hydrolase [Zunongwangia pacifica]